MPKTNFVSEIQVIELKILENELINDCSKPFFFRKFSAVKYFSSKLFLLNISYYKVDKLSVNSCM